MFVSPAAEEGASREIRIDQDFAGGPVPYSDGPFRLSAEQRDAATRMARNVQLAVAFGSDALHSGVFAGALAGALAGADTSKGLNPAADTAVTVPSRPFYGVPYQVVNTAEFISLPNMTEIFENLVSNVIVHYHRGRPHLQMNSENASISMYPPLLLIDDVPVLHEQSFLSVDPARIRRIEVIKET